MPECRTVRYLVRPVPEWKKAEPVWHWNKRTQSGIGMLRYRTKISKTCMPMPSYDNSRYKNVFTILNWPEGEGPVPVSFPVGVRGAYPVGLGTHTVRHTCK